MVWKVHRWKEWWNHWLSHWWIIDGDIIWINGTWYLYNNIYIYIYIRIHTLHYITWHDMTLHYITYIHTYIYTYIHLIIYICVCIFIYIAYMHNPGKSDVRSWSHHFCFPKPYVCWLNHYCTIYFI
jgi:hypothetical protein